METDLVADFLTSLRLKGKKAETIRYYRLNLRHYMAYLDARELSFPFAADKVVAGDYFRNIMDRDYSPCTMNRKIFIVYAFYQWLKGRGFILQNPCLKPSLPSGNYLPRSVPTPASIGDAFKRLKNSRRIFEQRDYVILELGYSCGLRRCELHNLNVEDINPGDKTIRVKGKYGKKRLVPVGEKCLAEVLFYVYHVRSKFLKHGRSRALFLSWRKGGTRMNIGTIDYVFRRIRRDYGLDNALTTHGLRHAFATHLLSAGARIHHISRMLGHVNLHTTVRYTRLLINDLKRVHEKYHPRG